MHAFGKEVGKNKGKVNEFFSGHDLFLTILIPEKMENKKVQKKNSKKKGKDNKFAELSLQSQNMPPRPVKK